MAVTPVEDRRFFNNGVHLYSLKPPCAPAPPKAPPMSDLEKDILMNFIRVHKRTLESTETDAATKVMKDNAWQQIASGYASAAKRMGIDVPRTAQQLKTYWKNLKAKVRKVDSDLKQDQLATGGGSGIPIDPQTAYLTDRVKSINPTINFTLENKWDSTSTFERGRLNDSNDIVPEKMDATDDGMVEDDDLIVESQGQYIPDSNHVLDDCYIETKGIDDVIVQSQGQYIPDSNHVLDDCYIETKGINLECDEQTSNGMSILPVPSSPYIVTNLACGNQKYLSRVQPKSYIPSTSQSNGGKGKRRGETDRKLGRSLRIFEEALAKEQALECGSNGSNIATKKKAPETVTSQGNSTGGTTTPERSPLKNIPQIRVRSYSELYSSSTDRKPRVPKNLIAIKKTDESENDLTLEELGPLKHRLAMCQENIEPVLNPVYKRSKVQAPSESKLKRHHDEDEQVKYKEEIFKETISAVHLQKQYWALKCESANEEKRAQMLSKAAAKMKLKYYETKCGIPASNEVDMIPEFQDDDEPEVGASDQSANSPKAEEN
ncbi:hypothetical protein QAD02_001964 [Eretmocerus hayati]|uniref:Uncharacterized protein n=1 Tax=Eretmocerus hayati TaxID=131215 RepID=A0ACC2NHL5_9HYME|nr:hypothetical protein QAD02_001964 [Eretmocerus hayati]